MILEINTLLVQSITHYSGVFFYFSIQIRNRNAGAKQCMIFGKKKSVRSQWGGGQNVRKCEKGGGLKLSKKV